MTNASRAPVDFDAFARDLGRPDAASGDAQPKGGHRADPLAELARIVGQDDPFRALLAARDDRDPAPAQDPYNGVPYQGAPHQGAADRGASWQGRTEPGFAPEATARGATPADAFDQYLASVERDLPGASDEAGTGPDHAEAPRAEAYGARDLKRVRPRRRLAAVGAGLGVCVLAVTGALTYKGLHRTVTGEVPVVQADTAPLKVAPKVADGVEIPDQNRQIYEPKARDSQIRIVNREEQPVDVAQAARSAQAASQAGSQAAAGGGVTPGNTPLDAFGEPRRVRTVSVRPEVPPASTREEPAEAIPAAIPTMTMPTEAAPAPRRNPRQASAMPNLAAQTTPVQPAPQATPVQPAPVAERPTGPAPTPVRTKAPQRMASVAPEADAPIEVPATTAATDAPVVSADPVGGFSVQLGVRNSAGDARAALREMQGKYSQLAGKPELIRQAEVNGKTLYRVRVGPLAKAEATGLCNALQGAGGQCFVAKN